MRNSSGSKNKDKYKIFSGLCRYTILSSARDRLSLFLPNFCALTDFSSLLALFPASSTMLTSRGPLQFFADLSGNVSSISLLSKILALGTKYIFYNTKKTHHFHSMLCFVKSFFSIYGYNCVYFLLNLLVSGVQDGEEQEI